MVTGTCNIVLKQLNVKPPREGSGSGSGYKSICSDPGELHTYSLLLCFIFHDYRYYVKLFNVHGVTS